MSIGPLIEPRMGRTQYTESNLRPDIAGRQHGVQYVPHRIFSGVCIPLGVLNWPKLPNVAKLVFGSVARRIGSDVEAVMYLEEIREQLDLSIDTVSRAVQRLERFGILTYRRTGRGSLFSCIWHPRLRDSLTPGAARLAELSPGELYSPFKSFRFALVPDSLASCRSVTHGAKLFFGLLALYGRGSKCFPADHTLATAMGAVEYQIRRFRTELIRAGLLDYDATRTKDHYHFLYHSLLQPSLLRSCAGPELPGNADLPERDCTLSEDPDGSLGSFDTNVGLQSMDEAAEAMIRRHLQVFEPLLQSSLDDQPTLVAVLINVAQQFSISKYELCSLLYNVWRDVDSKRLKLVRGWHSVVEVVRDRLSTKRVRRV